MMKVLISCIVPVYNSEKFIERTINSLQNQTLKDIEIILVNDGSTDNSAQICKQYNPDPRIHYIEKVNGGPSSARNVGINASKGEYILFVDADDYVDSDICEKAYRYATEYEADICLWDFYRNENTITNTHCIKAGYYDKSQIKSEILPKTIAYWDNEGKGSQIMWNLWLRLYRRSLIEKYHIRFDERFKTGEDMLFTLQATMVSQNLFYIPNNWRPYHYVAANGSLTSGYVKKYWEKRRILIETVYDLIESENNENALLYNVNIRAFLWTIIAINNEFKNYDVKHKTAISENIHTIVTDPIHKKYIHELSYENMDEYHRSFCESIRKADAKTIVNNYYRVKKKEKHKRAIKRIKSRILSLKNKIIKKITSAF